MAGSVATGIRQYFLANAGVAALIGVQMSPHEALPGWLFPYAVFMLDEFEQPRTLTGTLGPRRWVYAIHCCGDTFDLAWRTREAFKAALSTQTTADLDGVSCTFAWAKDSERDLHASAIDKSRFQLTIDLEIWER